jgi:hypothetical protein
MLAHVLQLHLLAAAKPGPPGVPDPGPAPVPGLQAPVNTIIGWGKWIVMCLGVIGVLICSGQMAIGRRNRHAFAADGAAGLPWVLGGMSLASIAAGVIGVFLHP